VQRAPPGERVARTRLTQRRDQPPPAPAEGHSPWPAAPSDGRSAALSRVLRNSISAPSLEQASLGAARAEPRDVDLSDTLLPWRFVCRVLGVEVWMAFWAASNATGRATVRPAAVAREPPLALSPDAGGVAHACRVESASSSARINRWRPRAWSPRYTPRERVVGGAFLAASAVGRGRGTPRRPVPWALTPPTRSVLNVLVAGASRPLRGRWRVRPTAARAVSVGHAGSTAVARLLSRRMRERAGDRGGLSELVRSERQRGLSSDARSAARAGAMRLPSSWRIARRLPSTRRDSYWYSRGAWQSTRAQGWT
jgi:hypothetical protein